MYDGQIERKLITQPLKCDYCSHEGIYYTFFLDFENNLVCDECASHIPISTTYKQLIHKITSGMPKPYILPAELCLQSLTLAKASLSSIFKQVRERIDSYETGIKEALDEIGIKCETYLKKVKELQNPQMKNWHKKPPRFIEQESYLLNINNSHKKVKKMIDSARELINLIPPIREVLSKLSQRPSGQNIVNTSIGSATSLLGSLYFGTVDGRIIYEKGLFRNSFQAHESLIRVLVSDDETMLYSGSDDFTIKAWRVSGEEPRLVAVFGSVGDKVRSYHRELVVTPDKKTLISSRGQYDSFCIRVWELETFSCIRVLQGHDKYIRGMVLISDHLLASVSDDQYLKVWDTQTGQCIHKYFHGRKITYLFPHPSSEMLCVIDQSHDVMLINRHNLKTVLVVHSKRIANAFAKQRIYLHVFLKIVILNWLGLQTNCIDVSARLTSTILIERDDEVVVCDTDGNVSYFEMIFPNYHH